MLYLGGIALLVLSVLAPGHCIPPFISESIIGSGNIVPSANSNLNLRLPNDTVPEAYVIELTTRVHTGDRDFTGVVEIYINVVETTSTITIHARQLTGFVASIIQLNIPSGTYIPLTTTYDAETEFLHLSAAGVQFPKGTRWIISINYKGRLRTDNGGFYISSYEDEQKKTHYLATTQFESTDARHAFPCYDEPAKRANFTIMINHDPSYFAISNMPVDKSQSTVGHTAFELLESSPTYLVAFIVSDFTNSTAELDMLPQRVFSRSGTEGDREFALLSGMLTMNRLNNYYGVKFPLPKLDIVAIPDFAAGAMENWGLTTYREEYSLYNPKTSAITTQNNVASTIAHENTHQWFGDLVALKWWSYVWLKEGFATLFENQMTSEAFPEWDYQQLAFVSHFIRTLSNDATRNARPMTYYIEAPAQIAALYDYVSYSKAGSVLLMWQNALTDTVFRRGIHNYLEINKYSAADEDDLFEAIQIAAGEENFPVLARVKAMMSSWTRQSNYPLLTVTRDYESGTFNVIQEAYFNDETEVSTKTWYIPFNFVTASNPDFHETIATHYLLKTKSLDVSDVNINKDQWLILNKQSTGVYRINYDLENWNLITEQLLNKHYKIHTYNRAMLLNDAYALSTSNRLKHSVFLKMLTYLPQEDQYAPWYSAYTAINTFNRFLKSDSQYKSFQTFVASLVEDAYDRLGPNDVLGQNHLEPLTRTIIVNLASLAGIESCLKDITEKITASIEQNIPIEPNMQSATYCNGLKQADDKTFNSVYDLLMDSADQALRRTLIRALGCSESPNQIKKFIESSIDKSNKLRTQERTTLLAPCISSSTAGIDQSIEFLQNNWDEYAALTAGFGGGNPAEEALISISSYVSSDAQYEKVKTLLNSVRSKLSANVESTIADNVASNLQWVKANGVPIMEWINQQVEPQLPSSATKLPSLAIISLIFCLCGYLL